MSVSTALHEVTAGVDAVFRIVDEPDDVVPVLSLFILIMQIELASVLNGGSVGIRDDFDVGMLGIGRIGCGFQDDGDFVRVEHDKAPDGDNSHAGHE